MQEAGHRKAEAVTLAEVFEIPADPMLRWGTKGGPRGDQAPLCKTCNLLYIVPCVLRCMEASPADRSVFMEALKVKYLEVRASITLAQDPQQFLGWHQQREGNSDESEQQRGAFVALTSSEAEAEKVPRCLEDPGRFFPHLPADLCANAPGCAVVYLGERRSEFAGCKVRCREIPELFRLTFRLNG